MLPVVDEDYGAAGSATAMAGAAAPPKAAAGPKFVPSPATTSFDGAPSTVDLSWSAQPARADGFGWVLINGVTVAAADGKARPRKLIKASIANAADDANAGYVLGQAYAIGDASPPSEYVSIVVPVINRSAPFRCGISSGATWRDAAGATLPRDETRSFNLQGTSALVGTKAQSTCLDVGDVGYFSMTEMVSTKGGDLYETLAAIELTLKSGTETPTRPDYQMVPTSYTILDVNSVDEVTLAVTFTNRGTVPAPHSRFLPSALMLDEQGLPSGSPTFKGGVDSPIPPGGTNTLIARYIIENPSSAMLVSFNFY